MSIVKFEQEGEGLDIALHYDRRIQSERQGRQGCPCDEPSA